MLPFASITAFIPLVIFSFNVLHSSGVNEFQIFLIFAFRLLKVISGHLFIIFIISDTDSIEVRVGRWPNELKFSTGCIKCFSKILMYRASLCVFYEAELFNNFSRNYNTSTKLYCSFLRVFMEAFAGFTYNFISRITHLCSLSP